MYDTIAHLVSEVLQDFGSLPVELLHPEHVMKGLAKALALRGLSTQQSREGRFTKVVPLTLNSRDSLLAGAPDMALPLYVERQVGVTPNESWMWIAPINQAVLDESRMRGDVRCSFYKEATNSQWHLLLSYDPSGSNHRLWYYTDPGVIQTLGGPLPIPARFAPMIQYDTIINCVPGVLMRAANLPEERQLNSGQLGAIKALLGHAQGELTKDDGWNELFKIENNRERATRGRMMRPILGRGYPSKI